MITMSAATTNPNSRSFQQVDAPWGYVDEGFQDARPAPAIAGDQRDSGSRNAQNPGGDQDRRQEVKGRAAIGRGGGWRPGFGGHEGSFHEGRHDAADCGKQKKRRDADSGHDGADQEARPDDVARGGQGRPYAVQIGLVLGHGLGMWVAGVDEGLLGGADVGRASRGGGWRARASGCRRRSGRGAPTFRLPADGRAVATLRR